LFARMMKYIGIAIMNPLPLTCTVLLLLWLSFTLFASSIKLFFTSDELTEMGVRLETPELPAE
jgi:hypothetical protein